MNGFYRLTLFLCFILFIHIEVVDSGIWVEDFNNPSLHSWIKHDPWNVSTWQSKDGHLDVWAQPDPRPGIYDDYVLQFVGFQFDTQTISVQLKMLEVRGANVGILIGQYDGQPEHLKLYDGTVAFFNEPVLGGTIVKPKEFELIKKEIGNVPIPLPLKAMEISFNSGDFAVFTQRKFIGKYHVPQLKTVNFLGIVCFADKGRGTVAHFILDDFVVMGPNVPTHGTLYVRPNGKVALYWGELKQR